MANNSITCFGWHSFTLRFLLLLQLYLFFSLSLSLPFTAAYFGLCHTPIDEFLWLKRTNIQTGEFESFNPRSKLIVTDQSKYQSSILKRATFVTFNLLSNPRVFFGSLIGYVSSPPKVVCFENREVEAHEVLRDIYKYTQILSLFLPLSIFKYIFM